MTRFEQLSPRQNPIDELLHRRDEAVRVKGITLEAERRVAREHQVLLDGTAVGDVLQRLLDAETARIGEPAGRILLIVRPGRESALRQTAHALGLVLADLLFFFWRHE